MLYMSNSPQSHHQGRCEEQWSEVSKYLSSVIKDARTGHLAVNLIKLGEIIHYGNVLIILLSIVEEVFIEVSVLILV